jgi:YfiH family protein
VVFTDRHGGASAGPFASLNLALEGGDDPEAVAENLRRVGVEFNDGGPVLGMRQVHGAAARVVDLADATPECDALVTRTPGVALLVRAADCVPVLLADPEAGVVGAAHAGRKGVATGIVPAAIDRMRELGAGRLTAWVGPHICGRCYEVPADLREEVSVVAPAAWSTTSWGTPALDLGAGVAAQLRAADIEVIEAVRCTREHDDLYSHRRDGIGAGRLGGLVRIRP